MSTKTNPKGVVDTLMILVITVVVVLVVVVFTVGGADSGKEIAKGIDTKNLNQLNLEGSTCFLKCGGESMTESKRLNCQEKPSIESDYTCGEVFAMLDELQLKDSGTATTTISTEHYSLEGDFQPCSKMKVIFSNKVGQLTDFSIKIVPKSTLNDAGAIPLTNTDGPIAPDADGYYKLCAPCEDKDSDNIYTEFNLPCDKKDELDKFSADISYLFTFKSSDSDKITLYDDTKIWPCEKSATLPEGLNFNQLGQSHKTKVVFNPELKKDDNTPLKANIMIMPGCIVNGVYKSECKDGASYLTELQYDNTGDYYYFIMPEVPDTFEEIRFVIQIPATDDGDVPVCTAKISKTLKCEDQKKYVCYDEEGEEQILSGPSATGTYTIDGVCKYTTKTAYKKGCTDISSGAVDENKQENLCKLPDDIYRTDTIINEIGEPACKTSTLPDIRIVDIYPCSIRGCDKNQYLTREDNKGFIAVEIKNIGGEDILFHKDNLHVTIEGNTETVWGVPTTADPADNTLITVGMADETTIPAGKTLRVAEIRTDSIIVNSHLIEGVHTVVAKIDNLDTAKYPIINVDTREKYHEKTEKITVLNKCCDGCTTCATEAICSGCSKVCRWTTTKDGTDICDLA